MSYAEWSALTKEKWANRYLDVVHASDYNQNIVRDVEIVPPQAVVSQCEACSTINQLPIEPPKEQRALSCVKCGAPLPMPAAWAAPRFVSHVREDALHAYGGSKPYDFGMMNWRLGSGALGVDTNLGHDNPYYDETPEFDTSGLGEEPPYDVIGKQSWIKRLFGLGL